MMGQRNRLQRLFSRPVMCAVVSLLAVPLMAQAVPATFSGTLIGNPPCEITGDENPISINFGEVGITRIDGVNYQQPLNLTITCGSDLGSNVAMYLAYDGMNATDFDHSALQTSRVGLGIRLSYQGSVITPNEDDLPITMSSNGVMSLTMTAVPVADPDPALVLLEGPFNAIATMEVRYP